MSWKNTVKSPVMFPFVEIQINQSKYGKSWKQIKSSQR